jgi:hypothetical protein
MRIDYGIALTNEDALTRTIKIISSSTIVKPTIASVSEQDMLSLSLAYGDGLYELLVIGNGNGAGQKTIRIKQGTVNAVANSFSSTHFKAEYRFIVRGAVISAVNLFGPDFNPQNLSYTTFTVGQTIKFSMSKATATDLLQIDYYRWQYTANV